MFVILLLYNFEIFITLFCNIFVDHPKLHKYLVFIAAFPFKFLVSNEVPEQPCVSPVSGAIFHRRLIEKYIKANGTDPVNNQPLTVEQLVDIKGLLFVVLEIALV